MNGQSKQTAEHGVHAVNQTAVINLLPTLRMLLGLINDQLDSQYYNNYQMLTVCKNNINQLDYSEWFTLAAEAAYEDVNVDECRPRMMWMLEAIGLRFEAAQYVTGVIIDNVISQIACLSDKYPALRQQQGRTISCSIGQPCILYIGVVQW